MPRTNNMTKKLSRASESTKNRFTIVLTDAQLQPYAAAATSADKPIEDILTQRLLLCAKYTAEKPIYFNDDQRRELEGMLEANFSKAEEVIAKVRPIASVTVDGVVVPLNSRQIERIKSRCFFGIKYEDKLVELINNAINTETGLF